MVTHNTAERGRESKELIKECIERNRPDGCYTVLPAGAAAGLPDYLPAWTDWLGD